MITVSCNIKARNKKKKKEEAQRGEGCWDKAVGLDFGEQAVTSWVGQPFGSSL